MNYKKRKIFAEHIVKLAAQILWSSKTDIVALKKKGVYFFKVVHGNGIKKFNASHGKNWIEQIFKINAAEIIKF